METVQFNAYNGMAASSSVTAKNTNSLDTADFLKLLSAQMTNQDVLDPSNSSDYISQLATFSSLQIAQSTNSAAQSQVDSTNLLVQLMFSQLGASLAGRQVTVAVKDDNGLDATVSGLVQRVNFDSNNTTVTIDGKEYELSSVLQVSATI